jgi:hypothetical protein
MTIIALDLDDTLYAAADEIYRALDKKSGKSFYGNRYSYDLSDVYGMPPEEIHAAFREVDLLERIAFDNRYPEILARAIHTWDRQHRAKVVFCTARAWHPDAHEKTKQALCRDLGEAAVSLTQTIVTKHGESKVDALTAVGLRPSLLADDMHFQVIDAASKGVHSILFTREWNRNHIWGNRVSNLESLIYEVTRHLTERLE